MQLRVAFMFVFNRTKRVLQQAQKDFDEICATCIRLSNQAAFISMLNDICSRLSTQSLMKSALQPHFHTEL